MISDWRGTARDDIFAVFAENPLWPYPANFFLIPDQRGFTAIDVGSGGASGREHLMGGLRQWGFSLKDLHTVILSHAHPDHMGALRWILMEVHPRVMIHHFDAISALEPANLTATFDIPLAKHCWRSLKGDDSHENFDLLGFFDDWGCSMSAAETVEGFDEGDRITIGDGQFCFEVVHTPGHSPGHVSFFERDRGLLLAGDLIGNSPAWYTPSSGGLIGYLDSLDKLSALRARKIIPAHGGIIEDPVEAIDKVRRKLLKREALISEALKDGPKGFMELNEKLFPVSWLNFFPGCGITECHLIKMEREGSIHREDGKIRLSELELIYG